MEEWEALYGEELDLLENSNPIDTLSSPNLVVKTTRNPFSPTKANHSHRFVDKENEPTFGQARKRRLIVDEDDEEALFLRQNDRASDIDAFFKTYTRPEQSVTRTADLKRARHSIASTSLSEVPQSCTVSDDDEPLFTSSPPTGNTLSTFSTKLNPVPTSDDADDIFTSSPLVASAKRRSKLRADALRLSTITMFSNQEDGDTACLPPSPSRVPAPALNLITLPKPRSPTSKHIEANDQEYLDGFNTPPRNTAKPSRIRKDESQSASINYDVDFAQSLSEAYNQDANMRLSTSSSVLIPGGREPQVSYTRQPTTGSFMCAVTSDGKSLYFPRRIQANNLPKNSIALKMRCSDNTSLLETPIWKLMEELDQERLDKAEQLSRTFARHDSDNVMMLDGVDSDLDVSRSTKTKGRVSGHQPSLWVEKYRPRQFLDLLGDQRLNRDVMKWVKQWDCCVFGKQAMGNPVASRKNVTKNFGSGQHKSFDEEYTRANDPYKRPDKKILLLTGPPGFGKTTLAHVIAKQAGYHVLEINASDDRTGEVVKSKVKAAIEMQALVNDPSAPDAERGRVLQKPTLLIIDEIDGVSSGGGSESFVKLLVNLVSVEAKQQPELGTATGSRKNKTAKNPLLRPIICICNDQYAPVLRPLRGVAQVVHFKKIPSITIAKRLEEICESENMTTDTRTLGHLCDLAEGDVRSCLNTLQFMRSRSSFLTVEMLDEAPVGRKDMGKSLFSIWEEIFQGSNSRKKQRMVALKSFFDEHGNRSARKAERTELYVSQLAQIIHTNGDFDKLVQGCFENYPKMKFHDVACDKLVQLGDWLHFYDQINHRANSMHEHGLYSYMPYPLVNFHRFFAGAAHQPHPIEYPNLDTENFMKEKTNEALIITLLSNMNPRGRRSFDNRSMSSELISLLLRIISPDLRPVNRQLIKPAERTILTRQVDIMIAFGLTYKQEKTDDGQFVYHLDPPIETLVQLSSVPLKGVLPSRYALRQLIAQEIDHEIMRRHEEFARGSGIPAKQEEHRLPSRSADSEKPPMDFFGRPIPTTSNTHNEHNKSGSAQKQEPKIWYKFHEGFSNAVRKPLSIRELW
ncbi:hypothetical protein BC936DRAFT_149509 [Jimgerdemannia flammicorona]|uniref:AAA+ ATPase domain-containing protein n=1 Tax=Jimgerdemannia flammicorona TaxID=994334 RepID=A0A433D0N7_9FUNG|nr:hypothetical protein BC936DRAFT_149509 [Jimgerdemannia flammicorona]